MSDVSEAAIVRLLLADYAAVDAANKVNIIGGGVSVIGQNPQAGFTAPFAVSVLVAVPPRFYGAEAALEIILEDASGNPVDLPGPAGGTQPMRVGQAITFERPIFQGVYVPGGTMASRHQLVLSFANGLPLAVGQQYFWRVKIDHETRPDWTEELFVPGPPPGPVLG